MKKIFYFIICIFISLQSSAQNVGDTIVVQTFVHDAYTDGAGNTTISLSAPRDTIGYFPNDPNLTFEKIIMAYNMRCKDGIVNTSGGTTRYGCGAYDYSCQTYVHDSTRVDSILNFTPDHIISNFSDNIYNYSNTPIYNYYHYSFDYLQYNTIIDSVINEDTISIGGANIDSNIVLNTNEIAGKSQFLYLADQLNLLSLNDTIINGLSIYSSNTQIVNFLKIKLKLTSDSILNPSSPHMNGFTEVYHSNTILNSGINRLQFYNAFAWDSISNIIIEFSFTDSANTSSPLILGEVASDSMGLQTTDASYIQVIGTEDIDIASSSLDVITDEITISFWGNGDENILPVNTSLFEALDSNGARTVNLHFPWNNGRIYWDCGNNSSSYDRIDKAASLNEYAGVWNHWAFTKNTTTGTMKIYHNGVIWHSGTGKTMPINIESFKLMSNGYGNNNWSGKLKELRIFNKELADSTIQKWIHKRLDSNHPNYSNLVAYYPFNDGHGDTAYDYSSYALEANFNGNVTWNANGEEIPTFFTSISFRPKISFYQGSYIDTMLVDTITVSSMDTLIATPNTVTLRDIFPNYGTMTNDSIRIIYVDTLGWEALSYVYSYDGNGLNISTISTAFDSTINITELTYYTRYPMAFQIMSFVTPYGGWLDLGENGKTWYFDVTDYTPILKGNKQITMSGDGQWQEDIDIKFLFIVGTPARNILEMQQIWRPQYKGYGTIMADRSFEPRDIVMNPNATNYKLKTTITGHGYDGEFFPQNHFLNIDGGPQEYIWPVWTECAENPVYPQGGTWIYDRAGWCPGQASDLREDDITALVNAGQNHNIDYGISSGAGTSNYWVSSQLVSYGSPNHTLDAAAISVLSPTNEILYSRSNPICSKPKIIIQNTGEANLTSLKIEYWINEATIHEVYEWNGNLGFLETAEVELPDPTSFWSAIDYSGGTSIGEVTTYDNSPDLNKFHVKISNPNSSNDQYEFNNSLISSFTPAPKYPNKFTFWSSTNSGVINGVSETSWEILDSQGIPIYTWNNLSPNSTYKDTLTFSDGCYSLQVVDSDHDGLEFWNNNDGAGSLRFRRIEPFVDTTSIPWSYHTWIKSFELDFGAYIHHEFTTSTIPLIINEKSKSFLNVYPNPTTDKLIVEGNITENGSLILQDNLGKTFYSRNIKSGLFKITLNLNNYANGIYFLKITSKDTNFIKKVIKQQ